MYLLSGNDGRPLQHVLIHLIDDTPSVAPLRIGHYPTTVRGESITSTNTGSLAMCLHVVEYNKDNVGASWN